MDHLEPAHIIEPRLQAEVMTVSNCRHVRRRYLQMRLAGQSHNIAEMLATRKFPGLVTDSTFNEGRCNGNQFEHVPGLGDHYRGIAEAARVSITGKHYCSGLADYPGDPTAWIDGRGDALRVARDKGFNLEGSVNYNAGERAPIADVEVADDLIESEVQDILESNPGSRYDDVRDQVYQVRTGKVDTNPLRVTDHNFEGVPA